LPVTLATFPIEEAAIGRTKRSMAGHDSCRSCPAPQRQEEAGPPASGLKLTLSWSFIVGIRLMSQWRQLAQPGCHENRTSIRVTRFVGGGTGR
jgi:hypothetical protein